MNVHKDKANPGQWMFGIVSWPVTDAAASREVILGFGIWQLVITLEKKHVQEA